MNSITREQLNYLAGIIDGEGTISIAPRLDIDSHSYFLIVQVTNTNLDLLRHLIKLTGLGRITEKGRKKSNHKNAYYWGLRVEEIKLLLPLLKEFLIIKRQQAELMLEYLATYSNIRSNSHRPLTLDQKIDRELIYEELKELNKRGT